jgi:hypothetical protein
VAGYEDRSGLRIAIELDGMAGHSTTDDMARDRKRQREIEALGWRVIRFGGKEVHHDPAACAAEARAIIARAVDEREQRPLGAVALRPEEGQRLLPAPASTRAPAFGVAQIWAQVQQRLSPLGNPRLTALLRDSCTPRGIEGDTFLVQVRAELDRAQIEARFRPAIEDALADVLGRAVTVRTLGGSEVDDRPRRRAAKQGSPPAVPDPVRPIEEFFAGVLLLHRPLPPDVRAELATFTPLGPDLAPLFAALASGQEPPAAQEDLAERLADAAAQRAAIPPAQLLDLLGEVRLRVEGERVKRELLQVGHVLAELDPQTTREMDPGVLAAMALKEQLAARFQKEQARFQKQQSPDEEDDEP